MNSTNTTWLSSIVTDSASTPYSEDGAIGQLRGYFVPPRNGEYRFRIHSGHETKLFFGLNESDAVSNQFVVNLIFDKVGIGLLPDKLENC